MATVKGIDFLVHANTGTSEVPVWTKIGGQRGATLNRSAETLDVTSKDSKGFKEFVPSFKEWSVEAEGLFIDGDTGFKALEKSYMDGTTLLVQMSTPSGDKYKGLAIITDLPLEAPYDDMATYSVTLQGSGELTKEDAL